MTWRTEDRHKVINTMENVPASKVSKDKKNCQPLFVDEVATTVVEGDKGV